MSGGLHRACCCWTPGGDSGGSPAKTIRLHGPYIYNEAAALPPTIYCTSDESFTIVGSTAGCNPLTDSIRVGLWVGGREVSSGYATGLTSWSYNYSPGTTYGAHYLIFEIETSGVGTNIDRRVNFNNLQVTTSRPGGGADKTFADCHDIHDQTNTYGIGSYTYYTSSLEKNPIFIVDPGGVLYEAAPLTGHSINATSFNCLFSRWMRGCGLAMDSSAPLPSIRMQIGGFVGQYTTTLGFTSPQISQAYHWPYYKGIYFISPHGGVTIVDTKGSYTYSTVNGHPGRAVQYLVAHAHDQVSGTVNMYVGTWYPSGVVGYDAIDAWWTAL